jgi:hypothetical protein
MAAGPVRMQILVTGGLLLVAAIALKFLVHYALPYFAVRAVKPAETWAG